MLAARSAVGSVQRARQEVAIANNVMAWLRLHPIKILGVYWPMRGEPDLRPLYAELAAQGMRLALPVVLERDAPLAFAAWSPGDALTADRMGISAPVSRTLVTPDALLVACVGFSDTGHRLGYGGGFYDRTLEQLPRPCAIGIATEAGRAFFACDAHDIAMDVVITERIAPGTAS